MRPLRLASLALGCLLMLPALGLIVASLVGVPSLPRWALALGAVLTAVATTLVVVGATGTEGAEPIVAGGSAPHPVVMTARLDPDLSRWQWLVKWALAIPHFVVLAFLWVAFAVVTVVAGVAILFTGRYPRGLFDFNVGVLRWSWRVAFYAHSGGIGTDRYPPFSLAPRPGDLATFDIAYPEQLSRGLVLVKWFIALPQLLIVAVLAGSSVRWSDGGGFGFDPAGGGLLGVLVIVAGIILLVDDRYPRSLFDLIIGLNRWVYRTIAYVALMTDVYPPYRLDQGGIEPTGLRLVPPPLSRGSSPTVAPAPKVADSPIEPVVYREPASV